MYIPLASLGLYRVDLYVGGKYKCTVPRATNLDAAKERFLDLHPEIVPEAVEAEYVDNDSDKNRERRRVNLWV